jgi:hypothetical protein
MFEMGYRLAHLPFLQVQENKVAPGLNGVRIELNPVARGVQGLLVGTVFVDNAACACGKLYVLAACERLVVLAGGDREFVALERDFRHQNVIVGIAGLSRI